MCSLDALAPRQSPQANKSIQMCWVQGEALEKQVGELKRKRAPKVLLDLQRHCCLVQGRLGAQESPKSWWKGATTSMTLCLRKPSMRPGSRRPVSASSHSARTGTKAE